MGSTVLAGPGSRALWIAFRTNGAAEVTLAHRDGCALRYLERRPGVFFDADTFIDGHLCCRDAVASVRCVAHTGWVELVTFVAVPTEGPMATGPDGNALPFTWERERLRLEHDNLVTLSHEEGHTPRRDALPRQWLARGFDCLGQRSY